uniref:Endoribonuclease n=1 Tax=Ditylenchus dipsaci TaxID=166011 RepID=A0A915CNM9_9BILA
MIRREEKLVCVLDQFDQPKNVLVGTSPEFEIAVYTVCALAQPINFRGVFGQVVHKKCVFDYLHSQVKAVVGVELGDGSWQRIVSVHLETMPAVDPTPEYYLEGRHHHHNSSHKPPHKKNETADPELQKLVDALWEADSEDRVSNSSITFNWGNKVDGEKDVSPSPLFNNVSEAFLERPVYKALLSIYNHSLFHPPVCTEEESMDDVRRAALDTFLTTVTNTTVFKLAYEYLKGKNKTGDDYASFHATLFNLWFGTYSRCDGAKGSSGWEHVFSGEFRDTIIEGQHYWVRFYLLEKAGLINYHGYYAYDANLLGTIQYKWNDYIKRIGGFLLRSSPAFDLSLFTVCSFTHSGNERCKFTINSNPLYVTSFKQSCDSGTCLSTSYPGMKF